MGNAGMMNYSMMGSWGMGFGPLVMVTGLVLLVVMIVLLIRIFSPSKYARITPVEILEERFARGEIDEDEFHQKRNHLER